MCVCVCVCVQDGRSALHLSIKRNHGNIVRYLCNQGASVNIQDIVSVCVLVGVSVGECVCVWVCVSVCVLVGVGGCWWV